MMFANRAMDARRLLVCASIAAAMVVGGAARGQDVMSGAGGAGAAVVVDDGSADAAPAAARIDPADSAADRFVPSSPSMNRPATLELRPDAVIFGAAIHLKQLCRWSSADGPTMTPVAELTVAQFTRTSRRLSITLDQLRATLQDAGVNLAAVRFEGAMSCTVTRGDADSAAGDDGTDPAALQQWIAGASQAGATPSSSPTPATNGGPPPLPVAPAGSTQRTLHDLLMTDLSQRLNLPVEVLEVNFDPKDRAVLNLSQPNFQFDVHPRMVRDLGDVSWAVTILSGGAGGGAASGGGVGSQRVAIGAQVRAWQDQLVTARSVSYGQVLREQDVEARRVLIDSLPDTPVLSREQVVGQQAARDLQPGMVMTARLVQAVPLAKSGQYVTVTLNSGTVQIRTVARALEAGSYGQAIKVKDEATREEFEVTLVGPQQATMGAAPVTTAAAGE
jgi:flagella basal body P-ring formation protein FlgA